MCLFINQRGRHGGGQKKTQWRYKMFTLIQSQNQSVEGNEAIRQINIELVTKEIARLVKIMAHEMDMDRWEEIDEIQEEIDELENTLDDLNHN